MYCKTEKSLVLKPNVEKRVISFIWIVLTLYIMFYSLTGAHGDRRKTGHSKTGSGPFPVHFTK